MGRVALFVIAIAAASAFQVLPSHSTLSRGIAGTSGPLSIRHTRAPDIEMAVPKKRQSKMKTRQRKANWYAQAKRQTALAWNRAMSAKYDPFKDPKYSFKAADADDEEDEE